MTLRETLESVTRDVFAQMRKVARFKIKEPCEWDINTGWCEIWAEAAADLTGGIPVWLDNTMVIKPTQRKTTMVLMDDGSQLSVEELLRKLNGTRIHGVEYQNLCQCDGSNHEMGMGCM